MKTDREVMQQALDHYRQQWSDICDENQGLRTDIYEHHSADCKKFLLVKKAERDALRADAMRYRWLRRVERGLRGWNVMHYAKCYTEETLDEVIDVAIGEKT